MQSYVVRNLRIPMVLAALGTIGCSSVDAGSVESSSPRSVRATTASIIGGEDSPASDSAVVQVLRLQGGQISVMFGGTGTLVAPNLVLTARHLIAPLLQTEEMIDCRPGETEVLFGPTYSVEEVGVFVDPVNRRVTYDSAGMYAVKEVVVGASSKFCDGDLAFLILEQPVPNVEPVALRLSGPPVVFETVSFVGYGMVSTASDQAKVRQRLDGMKINRYVPLDGLQSEMGEGTGTIMVDVLDRAPCVGDSGLPVLSAYGALIGVHSFKFQTGVTTVDPLEPYRSCLNSTAASHSVFDRKDFVLGAFAKAGYSHVEEEQGGDPEADAGAGAPLGASCEEGLDCVSNQCVDIGGAGVCTSDCTSATCPSGFSCSSAAGGKMLCLRQSESFQRESGCSIQQSNSPGHGSYATVVLLVGLACMRRRRR